MARRIPTFLIFKLTARIKPFRLKTFAAFGFVVDSKLILHPDI